MWFNLTEDDITTLASPIRRAPYLAALLARIRHAQLLQRYPLYEDYRNTADQADPAHLQDASAYVLEDDAGAGAWVMQWKWVAKEEAFISENEKVIIGETVTG